MQLSTVKHLIIVTCLILQLGCERHEPVLVKVASGPSFDFSGSGDLAQFTVFAPTSDTKIVGPFDKQNAVWSIDSSKVQGGIKSFRLEYGKVPSGYVQNVPTPPGVAPILFPGKIYAFWARTTTAAETTGFFGIGTHGVVRVAIPDLCFEMVSQREIATKCGTHKPYQQPTNIEEFLRQHEIPQ